MGEWNMAAALDVTNPNDLLYWAWTVLANVSEGNWSEQTPEWQAAVMKWRDAFHGYLDTLDNDGPVMSDPGEDWCGACLCGDHDQCLRTFDSMRTQPPRPCLCPHEIDRAGADMTADDVRQSKTAILDLLDGRHVIVVEAGYRGSERIIPPAGEDHAFDVPLWRRRIEVYVSRTGRSVRVWCDGQEIPGIGKMEP